MSPKNKNEVELQKELCALTLLVSRFPVEVYVNAVATLQIRPVENHPDWDHVYIFVPGDSDSDHH